MRVSPAPQIGTSSVTPKRDLELFKLLREFASESHADERVAAKWHVGHAVAYGVLIVQYSLAIAWHLAAAGRHRAAAKRKEGETPRFVG